MPFSAEQKRQHIRELQTYLHAISYFDNNITRVIPDGFYGKETALAVRAFQREYGLPETGDTDLEIWNKIVSVYREIQAAEPIAYNIFPSANYIMKQGDSGLLVYILQAVLDDLSLYYDNYPKVNITGKYDAATTNAVEQFQNRTGLNRSGNVNSGTWNMLVRVSEDANKTVGR